MDVNNLTTQELEKQYLALGGNPTHASFKNELAALQALSLEQYEHERQRIEAIESKRPQWAKHAGELAGKGLASVATIFTFVFVLGGLFFGTGALIAAEFMAVYEGFAMVSPEHALLYSVSIVLFYVVVLFIERILADKHGQQISTKTSLRLIGQDLLYFFGFGVNWQKQYNEVASETKQISTTVSLMTYAILAFGLLGRMKTSLETFQKVKPTANWIEGIQSILYDSSLQTMMGYIGMVIATAALLWATKWVVHFIYGQFKRVTGGVVVQDFSEASLVVLSPTEHREAAERQLLTRKIMRLEAKNKKSE